MTMDAVRPAPELRFGGGAFTRRALALTALSCFFEHRTMQGPAI